MITMSTTTCDSCGIEFVRSLTRIKRNTLAGRKQFCSQSCCGKSDHIQNGLKLTNPIATRGQYVKEINRPKNVFLVYLKRTRQRGKIETTLTEQNLRDLWNKQKGICPYSKVKLELSDNKGVKDPIYTASLDRIDSNVGYIPSNIQFISIAMNRLKHVMTHAQTLQILEILKNNNEQQNNKRE
jgi:hypothetical protein